MGSIYLISNVYNREQAEHPEGPIPEGVSPDLSDDQSLKSDLSTSFSDVFMGPDRKLGQTNLTEHFINTGDAKPIQYKAR